MRRRFGWFLCRIFHMHSYRISMAPLGSPGYSTVAVQRRKCMESAQQFVKLMHVLLALSPEKDMCITQCSFHNAYIYLEC